MQLLSPPVRPAPPAPPAPPPPRRAPRTVSDRWAVVVLAASLAAVTLNAARSPFDSDGWWHLRSGELILDRGGIPRDDPFAWTAAGRPWRLNSWLYDVLAAGSRRLGGVTILIALTLLATAVFGCVCYLLARRAGARPWPSVAVTSVFMILLTHDVAERPQLVSYLLFAAMLVLCQRALRGSNRAFVALIALFAFWSNLHFAFAIGVLTVLLLSGADAVRERRLARPLLVAGAAAAGGLCNPFGFSAYTAAFETRDTSYLINEWQHVNLTHPRDVVLVLVVVVTLASLWRTGRWKRLDSVLPVAMFCALTLDAIRNAPFLFIVAAPEVALALSTLAIPRTRALVRPRAAPLVHGLALGLGIIVVSWTGALADPRPTTNEIYPVRSTAAIPAGCRLLNEYDFGGYVTDSRWPEVLVSQDGRNGSEQGLRRQQRVLAGRPGSTDWLDRHHVDCVLAKPTRPLVAQLRADGWRRVASDPSAVLLLRP